MLELTRRMTPARTCFDRVAGSYRDEDGIEDGSFNIHFLKLTEKEKAANLKIARAIPFSETKVQLRSHKFPGSSKRSVEMARLLYAMKSCALKMMLSLKHFMSLSVTAIQAREIMVYTCSTAHMMSPLRGKTGNGWRAPKRYMNS